MSLLNWTFELCAPDGSTRLESLATIDAALAELHSRFGNEPIRVRGIPPATK